MNTNGLAGMQTQSQGSRLGIQQPRLQSRIMNAQPQPVQHQWDFFHSPHSHAVTAAYRRSYQNANAVQVPQVMPQPVRRPWQTSEIKVPRINFTVKNNSTWGPTRLSGL